MNINKNSIVRKTHYGLTIYSHILREYLPGETVLSLIGNECKPVKNPFTQTKNKTLNIKCVDWIFIFEDTENMEYKGDLLLFINSIPPLFITSIPVRLKDARASFM
jgi:hypothetical protein